jgi:hypothetical protein
MPRRRTRRWVPLLLAPAALALGLSMFACGGPLVRQYEYEEDIHLSLNGSAVVYVNASVPALVALRGLDLDPRPSSRLDRAKVRELFTTAVGRVSQVSASRRAGRRFVHVRVDVPDIRQLGNAPAFAWSTYRFAQAGGSWTYEQKIGPSAGRQVGQVGWTGNELVAFRLHIPSRVEFHNTLSEDFLRGNILIWEQPLASRLVGQPLEIQVRMQTQSILHRTLLLFATSGFAAIAVLAALVWWVVRKGSQARA